jgi:hypothetical protein
MFNVPAAMHEPGGETILQRYLCVSHNNMKLAMSVSSPPSGAPAKNESRFTSPLCLPDIHWNKCVLSVTGLSETFLT